MPICKRNYRLWMNSGWAESRRDGSDGSALPDLHRMIRHLRRDLELQMRKEETILFPAILELEATVAAAGQPDILAVWLGGQSFPGDGAGSR